MLLLVFLQPNLAVAVVAAIASVAFLVAVVIVVLDLRHDGFKNKEREGGWGEGAAPTPQGAWEGCSVLLLCCCSLVGFVVVGFVPYSSCCWPFLPLSREV